MTTDINVGVTNARRQMLNAKLMIRLKNNGSDGRLRLEKERLMAEVTVEVRPYRGVIRLCNQG